jgi:membrane protein implicated in regulation of membrane protease activity
MSTGTKYVLGGAAGVVLLAWLTSWWFALLVLIGVPVAGYLMLDPSQRRRLRRAGRGEIGR